MRHAKPRAIRNRLDLRSMWALALAAPMLAVAAGAGAGEADVVAVTATPDGAGWRFAVTVAHADAGWDHYADRFEVLTPAGELLGTRTLHHPHVDEQPFTRLLGGVSVPEGLDRVVVRAHDSVHGHGGATMTVTLDAN